MNNVVQKTYNLSIGAGVIILIIILGIFFQINKNKEKMKIDPLQNNLSTTTELTSSIATTTSSTPAEVRVTILVPDNIERYIKAMDAYVSDGGKNPADTWVFVEKTLPVAYTTDLIRASADAVANIIKTGGGPKEVTVAYLKVENGNAYVLLNIDLDGWAGVSFATAKIHPLIEKTLLQFSEIKKVEFGYAPGDKK